VRIAQEVTKAIKVAIPTTQCRWKIPIGIKYAMKNEMAIGYSSSKDNTPNNNGLWSKLRLILRYLVTGILDFGFWIGDLGG
jgi:hypothetical protein